MSEGLDPDAIRARSFSTSRRGFERAEVEAFQEDVAGRVAELSARLSAIEAAVHQVGITDLRDLKTEFDTVGEDVSEILQAARDAAADMRDRASADAEAKLTEAQQQAEELRGAAWTTSEQMLQQVAAAADDLNATAHEDSLFIRAEAEREALRMTGDAKRDAEELARTAQNEAEATIAAARAESESMVESARQSADLAQERVRALEQRREELMAELEETRKTLTELEDTIEGRRSELVHATTDPSESSVRVIGEDDATKPEIGDWLDEDATVRLVPPPPEMPMDPVDADELVAEVASMRLPVPDPVPPSGAEPEPAVSASSVGPASMDFEITGGDSPAAADTAATAELPEPAAATEEESGDESDEVIAEPSPATAVPANDRDGGIDDLFASLRVRGEPNGAVTTSDASPEPVPAALADDVAAAAEPSGAVATAGEPGGAVATTGEPGGAVVTAVAVAGDVGPFELRDRMLMPVTNEVLRGIKRAIVDVQNAVLEEVRTNPDDWRPKKAMFDDVMGEDAAGVAPRCYLAGVAAAGELVGSDPPQLPDRSTHSLANLVTDLWEAVVDAIDGTPGGNSRERGASVGRIFRAWRTDEAERRVRQVAHAEYNAGVAAGLEALGVAFATTPAGRDQADPDATVIPSA